MFPGMEPMMQTRISYWPAGKPRGAYSVLVVDGELDRAAAQEAVRGRGMPEATVFSTSPIVIEQFTEEYCRMMSKHDNS